MEVVRRYCMAFGRTKIVFRRPGGKWPPSCVIFGYSFANSAALCRHGVREDRYYALVVTIRQSSRDRSGRASPTYQGAGQHPDRGRPLELRVGARSRERRSPGTDPLLQETATRPRPRPRAARCGHLPDGAPLRACCPVATRGGVQRSPVSRWNELLAAGRASGRRRGVAAGRLTLSRVRGRP